MLRRLRPDRKLRRLVVLNDFNLGHFLGERLDDRLEPLALGRGDREDHQGVLFLGGQRAVDLFDRSPDQLLVGLRGDDDKPLAFFVHGDFGFRRQPRDHRGERLGRLLLEVDHAGLGVVRPRLGGLDLGERIADRGLRFGRRQDNQPLVDRVELDFRAGGEALQQRERRRRIGRGELVDFELARLVDRGGAAAEFFHRRAEDFVLGGRGERHQVARLRVDRELGVGHQCLEAGEKLGRSGGARRGGQPRDSDRVDFKPPLLVGRTVRVDLFEGRLDCRLLGGAGPDQQPVGLRVEGDFRVRKELSDHLGHAGRIGRPERIGRKLELFLGRQLLAELIEDAAEHLVLRRPGPDRQLAGLRVGDHLHARQLRRNPAEDCLEAVLLLGGDGVDDKLRLLFRRQRGGCLLEGFLHDLVIGRRGNDGQVLAARIGRDLGLGGQRLEDREHGGGQVFLQRVEADFRPRCAGIFDRRDRLDDLLVIGRRGDDHQAAVFAVGRDLGLGGELAEQLQDIGGQLLLERMETQLGGVLGQFRLL